MVTYTAPQLGENAACKTRVIGTTLDARMVAVDLRDGKPCVDFGVNGQVDLWQDIGKVPGWYADQYPDPGARRGRHRRASARRPGHRCAVRRDPRLQCRHRPDGLGLGPGQPGQCARSEAGPDLYARHAEHVGRRRRRRKLGLVYLPVANASIDYVGSHRTALEKKYADSLVAVDVTTGRDVLALQVLHQIVGLRPWQPADPPRFPGRGRK